MSEELPVTNENTDDDFIPVLYPRRRIKYGLLGTFAGFLMVVLGAKPEFFGMDRSPVIGFMQTAAFLVGIGVIALSGYFCLMSFWPKGYDHHRGFRDPPGRHRLADRGFLRYGGCLRFWIASGHRACLFRTAAGSGGRDRGDGDRHRPGNDDHAASQRTADQAGRQYQ